MARRTRKRLLKHAGLNRTALVPNEATAPARKPSKAPLVAPFYVAVDRQLKSGHETYEAAEKAAVAVKKRYPRLHVTVYEAKVHRHTVIEPPKPAASLNNKISARGIRNALARGVSVAGVKH